MRFASSTIAALENGARGRFSSSAGGSPTEEKIEDQGEAAGQSEDAAEARGEAVSEGQATDTVTTETMATTSTTTATTGT